MTPEKLLEAAETMGWIVSRLNAMPEQKEQALLDSLSCSMTQLFCLDLAKSLMNNPDDPYAALVSTIKGETKLTESQQTLCKILFSRGAGV